MDTSLLARGATPIDLDKPRLLFYDKTATWLLQQKFGEDFPAKLFTATPLREEKTGKLIGYQPRLQSMEALEFFLFVGLQAEANASQETLTLQQAGDFLMPSTYKEIFRRVVMAVTRGIHTPPIAGEPGKADAAAAGPAVAAARPASRKASTTRKPSASLSPSSVKRRPSSGRKR